MAFSGVLDSLGGMNAPSSPACAQVEHGFRQEKEYLRYVSNAAFMHFYTLTLSSPVSNLDIIALLAPERTGRVR